MDMGMMGLTFYNVFSMDKMCGISFTKCEQI